MKASCVSNGSKRKNIMATTISRDFPNDEINTSLFKHFRTRNLTPETEMVWATTAPLGTHTLTFILERVTKLNETNRYSKEFLSIFVPSKFFSIFTRQFISTGYSF
jgi:hypothetical protein